MRNNDSKLLRDDEERFQSAFEHTNVAMVLTDMNHRFVRVNTAFARLLGYSELELLKLSMPEITHPDDLADSYTRREGLLAGESHFFQMEKRYLHKDGQVLWGLTNVSILRDSTGIPFQYVGQVQDITERKRVEEQLRRAQKMEAVGRLAGGLAHDFNNSLTVIIGYSDVALGSLGPTDPVREMVGEIRKAGSRAASLTRQLLAFSRKQVLAPEVLDLNELLIDMEKLLPRLIGEDIDLLVNSASNLWPVKADAGQMEQVIMNLVINARHAMPEGGKLTIETANIELGEGHQTRSSDSSPGQYVLLAVSDTGCGMDDVVKSRIFEPFFTTKGPEQGTGLGLATVWGIVNQSGGYIDVDSGVGLGTAFTIYLPRTQEVADSGKSLIGPAQPFNCPHESALA